MPQIWLVPVDEPSFQETLDKPIDLSDYPNKPAEFPTHPRVWGVRTDPEQGSWERNRRNLEQMQSGDPLLFYRNSLSEYHAKGQVGEFCILNTFGMNTGKVDQLSTPSPSMSTKKSTFPGRRLTVHSTTKRTSGRKDCGEWQTIGPPAS